MKLEDTERELWAAMGSENYIAGDDVVIPAILPIFANGTCWKHNR